MTRTRISTALILTRILVLDYTRMTLFKINKSLWKSHLYLVQQSNNIILPCTCLVFLFHGLYHLHNIISVRSDNPSIQKKTEVNNFPISNVKWRVKLTHRIHLSVFIIWIKHTEQYNSLHVSSLWTGYISFPSHISIMLKFRFYM